MPENTHPQKKQKSKKMHKQDQSNAYLIKSSCHFIIIYRKTYLDKNPSL